MNEALEALREDIDIAIYDASNITKERRRWLAREVAVSGLHIQVRLGKNILATLCVVGGRRGTRVSAEAGGEGGEGGYS